MRNANQRRVAAFRLEPARGQPVLYLAGGSGLVGYTGEGAAAESAGLPRWLVRQVGYVEGVSDALGVCCPECRQRLMGVADGQMELWAS